MRGTSAVERVEGLHVHAGRVSVDGEDRQAVAVATRPRRGVGGARDHEKQPGRVAMEHQRLAAVDPITLRRDAAPRLHVAPGRSAHPLRSSAERRPACSTAAQRGQPLLLLRGRASIGQQLACHHDAGSKAPPPSARPSSCATSITSIAPCSLPPSIGIEGQGRAGRVRPCQPSAGPSAGCFGVAAVLRRIFAVAEALHRIAQRQ